MSASTTLQAYNALILIIRAEQEKRAGKHALLSYRNIMDCLKKIVANETLTESWETQVQNGLAQHHAVLTDLIEFFRQSAYAQGSGSSQRSPLDKAWVL